MQHTRDHVVPDLGSIGVTMSDRDDLTLANRDRSTPYKQYVMFLRPGYSAGHAIVMANYTCGNLCGSSWLVLLRADGDTWQIASVRLMSVS